MSTYGEYNLPILINRYPHYKKELGAGWVNSIKGYLLFNPILNSIIKTIYLFIPLQILIRYMVINAFISGARKTRLLLISN